MSGRRRGKLRCQRCNGTQTETEKPSVWRPKLYRLRGFQRRIGFGRKPAAGQCRPCDAWTRPGNPFTCEDIDDQIIPGVQRLLEACRANNHLVVHVTTCYQITDRENPHTDMGLWHHKIPIEAVDQSKPELWAIDSRIAPLEGEHVLIKKQASAFHGTYLASYLHAAGIDTILVTGVTATACVRQTICDGLADGFRPIAVKECIGRSHSRARSIGTCSTSTRSSAMWSPSIDASIT